jgi:hypothetical protein
MSDAYQGSGEPISLRGLKDAYEQIGCKEETLWALLTVETRGFGYQPDRRPKILFERHVFHRLTNGRYDDHSDISAPTPGGYAGGAAEYERLDRAIQLDEDAALRSTSWGLGQIMGFNAGALKYPNVGAMVGAFVTSEDAQLEGVCRYITANPPLREALRSGDWKTVAFCYNGSAFAKNDYDAKLRLAYERYRQDESPDVNVRAAQAYLTYLGFDPNGIDGYKGQHTLDALHRFHRQQGMEENDTIDDGTVESLRQAFAAKRL